MYSIHDYGMMFNDSLRMQAYTAALEQVITPSSIVVDIGTGTGIFALLACKFGAARVYAIETNDAIQVAAQIAQANGYADRIQFIQKPAEQVTLPELADVIVSDLRGTLPLYDQHLPTIMDARRRFLKPDGVLIPRRDRLYAALITAPTLYADYSSVWEAYSFDMRAGRSHAINTSCTYRPPVADMLTAAQSFATLDYQSIESPNITGKFGATIRQQGTAHGFSVWFDADVADGLAFSNAPEAPEQVYGEMFLPLEQAVAVEVGDWVEVTFRAKLIGGDYVWQWNTSISTAVNQQRFKQSTLLSLPLSTDLLRKSAPDCTPKLNGQGRLLMSTLQYMQGNQTAHSIAQRLYHDFADQFPDEAAAQSYVTALVARYSQ